MSRKDFLKRRKERFARRGTRSCADASPPRPRPEPKQVQSRGPGAELKKLLRRFGITPGPNCKCTKRAATMDQRGPDWCQRHLGLITDWLAEEAQKRKLPFLRTAGKVLIRRAIRNARADTVYMSTPLGAGSKSAIINHQS